MEKCVRLRKTQQQSTKQKARKSKGVSEGKPQKAVKSTAVSWRIKALLISMNSRDLWSPSAYGLDWILTAAFPQPLKEFLTFFFFGGGGGNRITKRRMDTDETAEIPWLLSQLSTFRSLGPLRKDDPSYQAV